MRPAPSAVVLQWIGPGHEARCRLEPDGAPGRPSVVPSLCKGTNIWLAPAGGALKFVRRRMAALARAKAGALASVRFPIPSMCSDDRPLDEERSGRKQSVRRACDRRSAGRSRRRARHHVAASDDRSVHDRMPQARNGQSCLADVPAVAADVQRGFRRAPAVGRTLGAALCRRRGVAGGALLGRRRLRLQAQDQRQWRAADLCRSALHGARIGAARA
ncbi:hypothetical protein ACVI1J_004889 [Bradyrhizobium diazoefficiens]